MSKKLEYNSLRVCVSFQKPLSEKITEKATRQGRSVASVVREAAILFFQKETEGGD